MDTSNLDCNFKSKLVVNESDLANYSDDSSLTKNFKNNSESYSDFFSQSKILNETNNSIIIATSENKSSRALSVDRKKEIVDKNK